MGRHRRHPQFDIFIAVLFKTNFSVLGLAAFGDIQVRHDLDSGDDRVFIAVWNGLIKGAGAVHADPDFRILFAGLRLNMNIRSPPAVGIYDDLVNQLHHRAAFF